MEKIIKACLQCGDTFSTDIPKKKFCCKKCANIYNHKPKAVIDDSAVDDMLQKHNSDWEYVGGYTGSDGTAVVRHKVCGFTTRRTCVTLRHSKTKCMVCEERERKKKAETKARKRQAEAEARKFFRPVKKVKQISMKECPICGRFFVGRGKYCGADCARVPINRYSTAKKRKRMKSAWTEESKTITLAKLYKRDGGVCWICGGQCKYGEDVNANDYPSIDHIIPIALGGMDRWENIKLAHRICNSLRGAEDFEEKCVGFTSPSP